MILCCVALGMMIVSAQAQETATKPQKITYEAQEEPLSKIVAALSEQMGIQIGVLGPAPERLSLSVKEATPDEAVKALAEAMQASWLRAYLLEAQPPAQPLTAEQILARLQEFLMSWIESLSSEQQEALAAQAFMQMQATTAGMAPPALPGAGKAILPASSPMERSRYDDPARRLILPFRTEEVTLQLDNKPLKEALFALTKATGFLVAPEETLTGNVSLQAEKRPLEEVVEEIAEAIGAAWRPVYLVSIPRLMSEEERERMIEDFMRAQAQRFWAKPKEEREREINIWVQRLQRLSQIAKQPTPDGRPNLVSQMLKQYGPRLLAKMAEYSAELSTEQRMELKPLMRALGEAIQH